VTVGPIIQNWPVSIDDMLDDVDFRPASVEVDRLRVDSTIHKFLHTRPLAHFLRIVDAVSFPASTAPAELGAGHAFFAAFTLAHRRR
jgi:hypothetical protein